MPGPAYVGGDPVNFVDPMGLTEEQPDPFDEAAPDVITVIGRRFIAFDSITADMFFSDLFALGVMGEGEGVSAGSGGEEQGLWEDVRAQACDSESGRTSISVGGAASLAVVIPGVQAAINLTIHYPDAGIGVQGMQVSASIQGSGTLGVGAYVGAGATTSYGMSGSGPSPGFGFSAPYYAEAQAGWGPSGGVGYERDWGGGRGNGVLTAGLPIPRIGAGAGAYVGGGRAIKLTLSTPPLFCG